MNVDTFWQLIDSTRRRSKGDQDEHINALTTALSELPEDEIVAFARIFNVFWARAYSWDLWAAAYIIGGGCSDDGFMDFRAWLISKGRRVYENALITPDSLAKAIGEDEECQIEGFQYVAGRAWAKRTGRDYYDFPHPEAPDTPEPSGLAWKEESEDDLSARCPKLFKTYGNA